MKHTGAVRTPTGEGEVVDDREDVVHSVDAPTGLKILSVTVRAG